MTSETTAVIAPFKAFVEKFDPMDKTADDLAPMFIAAFENWKVEKKANSAKASDINLSNFVRFLYDFSPKPGEGDSEGIQKAIQAAHYLNRKVDKAKDNAPQHEKEEAAPATGATRPASSRREKASPLEQACVEVLAQVTDSEQAVSLLGNLPWQDKATAMKAVWSAVSVLMAEKKAA